VRLRCEYQDDPIGIDTLRPRLSWWPNDSRPAELQTGFHIQAASTLALLRAGTPDLWDTGHAPGRQTLNVDYGGRPLASAARVWWRVRCYDSDGAPSPWSDPARFEIGLLESSDWQAEWIATPLSGTPYSAAPAPLLWRDFELPQVPGVARLYVAVLGAALWEINGRPVGDDEPTTAWADLTRRVPYRVYDVTGLLVPGANRLGAQLGDGDFCGAACGGPRQQVGVRPSLCAQLVLEDAAGGRRVIGSGANWCWHPSWILRADRDGGEEIDGRQYLPRWSLPNGLGPKGYPVDQLDGIDLEKIASGWPAAVVQNEHSPVGEPARERTADGLVRIRYDFGVSLLGRIRVRFRARHAATLTVSYADTGAGWHESIDRYTARGDGTDVFEPRFALHAFRWVEITSSLQPHEIDEVVALEVGVRAVVTGDFRCDHRLLEQLFEIASRTCRMGLVLGPVTGLLPAARGALAADVEPILAGAGASIETGAAFDSWARTLRQALIDAGFGQPRMSHLSAVGDFGADDGGQEEALLPLLWHLYRRDGNRRLLEQSFPAVQRHLFDRGERCAALLRGEDDTKPVLQQLREGAWYCYALGLATRMAGVLGRLADLENYDALARRLRLAFRARFVTRAGLLAVDDQLTYLLALELGLLDDDEREVAVARLESQLRANGFRPSVDLRHGARLLEVLTLEGRPELAYQTLLQTAAPSWLSSVGEGATSLWDPVRGQSGRMAVACIASWLQRFLLGLELDGDLTPELNAYRRMRIQPRPPLGPEFAAGFPIRHASGHLDTVHGRYECAWNVSSEGFRLRVRVPGNCSARVILPDGYETIVVAGEHDFHMPPDQFDASARLTLEAAAIPLLRSISRVS
jgi:alpha-L-rhamnosidase